jgi:hypothetical protein
MARKTSSQQQAEDAVDPDDDEIEPEDEDDEEDDDDEEEEEYKPPTKEEWAKTQSALKKANTEAKRFRTELRTAREKAKDTAGVDPDKAAAKVEAKWKPRVVRSEARAQLAAAGAKSAALTRLARMIDLDDVEVDDDGEVTGLEELIDEMKEDLPELFKDDDDEPAPKRRRLGKTDAGSKSSSNNGTKPKTASERQAAAILGR